MCWTSRLVHKSLDGRKLSFSRLPANLRQLWMGQCNCAYWHGIFGGLYLPHLRRAIYECLIRAETLSRARSRAVPEAEEADIDLDGFNEIRLANQQVNIFIKPSCGGSIVELDDRYHAFNLTDTLARRREAYHYQMEAGPVEGGEKSGHSTIHDRQFSQRVPTGDLITDPYPRGMLREHFFPRLPQDHWEASRNALPDCGDFADGHWQWRLNRKDRRRIVLSLSREGEVRLPSCPPARLALTKRLSLSSGSGEIEVAYRIKNLSEQTLDAFIGVSFNFTVLGPKDPQVGLVFPDGRRESLASGAVLPPMTAITVFNRREKVDLSFVFSTMPAILVQYPVETISQSESGIDRTYQASCLLPVWPVKLNSYGAKALKLTFSITY